MALVRPRDLPTAEEMQNDSALTAIVNWKETQRDGPGRSQDTQAAASFVEEHMPGFFQVMRESIALMK